MIPSFVFCIQNKKNEPLISTSSEKLSLITIASVDFIQLISFKSFPPEIEGCACYYLSSEIEFKNTFTVNVDVKKFRSNIKIINAVVKYYFLKTLISSVKICVSPPAPSCQAGSLPYCSATTFINFMGASGKGTFIDFT